MQAADQEQLEQWRLCLAEGERRERKDVGSVRADVDEHISSSCAFKECLVR